MFLKLARAGLCVMLGYVSHASSHKNVENWLHGGADKCQLRHTHDGPRPVQYERPRNWLSSCNWELCSCSVQMDNLGFTTRCRLMQRSHTKAVFSFLIKWSLLIFLMKWGMLLHLYGNHVQQLSYFSQVGLFAKWSFKFGRAKHLWF